MPPPYAIDPVAGVARIAIKSALAPADARALLRAIAADPAYRPGMPLLVDRRSNPDPPTAGYVRALAEVLRDWGRSAGPCRAAVLAGDLATFGMMRMAAALASDTGVEVGAFRSEGLARRWLAGDDDAIRSPGN